MKYFIKTFGCQMNVSDSERIAAFLESQGFFPSEKIQNADLAIFNTCGIKQTAENRAYSMIHNLRKENKNHTSIVMTGCLANRSDVQRRMKKSVDLFTEVKNFQENFRMNQESRIKNQAKKIHDSKFMIHDSEFSKENIDYLSIIPKHTNNFTAYVPIMTGCNNFCAYCVVPYARGREVSRPANEIISEVKNLIKTGYKNIVLLGQNVNSYNGAWDMELGAKKKMSFPMLLKKLDKIPGRFWISYVSSHPKDMSDELIEATAKCKKVCEWIHLPVQAGNNKILQKMNRKYTQEQYLELIKKIRNQFKKHKPSTPFAISSDIIVGFPGETKKQFLDSAAVMEKAKFDMVFFGQYSPRPNTVAWKMKDNISTEEKKRREEFLNEILKKTTFANNKKYIGKKIEVLIEKEKNGFYFGKTRTQKNVKIKSNKKNLIGQLVKVKITKANVWNLEAENKIKG